MVSPAMNRNTGTKGIELDPRDELLSRCRFATKDQARREIARFIDVYDHRRRHSSCEMLSPVAYEAVLAGRAAETAPQPEAA